MNTIHTAVGARQPNRVVHDLGHNEQMQLGIAVSLIADVLRGNSLVLDPDDLIHLDLDTLCEFEGILNLPGLVQITKEVEQP